MAVSAATAAEPWPVGVLADQVKGYIDRLGQVWIEGEITQWSVRGGAVYGKLKDLERDATVSFQLWSSVRARLSPDLRQGDRVIALAKLEYWVKGGSLSLQVVTMRQVGLGDLLEKLERLRRTLAAEGLFAPARKRALPFLPGRLGLVTGKDSDAEKDVLQNARLRWPDVDFRVVHAAVQGDQCVPEVLGALSALEADASVDVVIVARGGGDFQNLLGFSDERLLRLVAAMTTPVVSAIGHEADRPLLDDVADLRASTPTDAAKRVVPDVGEERDRTHQARARLRNRVVHVLRAASDHVEHLRARPVLAGGDWLVDRRADDLVRLASRGAELVSRCVEAGEREVAEARGHLRALSPLRTLERGYAIVLAEGAAVRSGLDAPSGTALAIRVADGGFGAVSTGPPDSADGRTASEAAPTLGDHERREPARV